MSLDPRQREAAEAPASVVVTAGAGTGKTHMLARRYLHHLRAGLRPLQVVAVTFTRRAAEELRARVREVVRQGLRGAPEADGGLDDDVLAEVEAAPIGTIHALAQWVCRRFPEEAGVPPDFRVVDELDGELWAAEALDEALERLPDADVVGLPYTLLRQVVALALRDPTRAREALAVDPARVRAALDGARAQAYAATVGGDAWRSHLAVLAAARGPEGHEAETARRAALAAAERLAGSGPGGDAADAAEAWAALTALVANRGTKRDWIAGDLGAVKAALRALRDDAREVWRDGAGPAAWRWGAREALAAEHVERLRGSVERALAIVDERKRRARALAFPDLETHALRALDRPSVRADLHRRWRALLVDEAQDVNPTQARLLAALRADDAPLTAVGDAKQSIYGFRGADAGVLEDLRDRVVADGGRAVELATSYRTHRDLVEAVNRVFDRAWGDAAGPLAAHRPTPEGLPAAVRWQRVRRAGGASAAAAAEAEAIAAAILGWVRADPPVELATPAGPRPLGFGDVAVLARGHAVLAELETRLPALGVPVLNAGGGDVLATREAGDVRALLRAVVDPTDALAVAALLRSPFVAASDADVARHVGRVADVVRHVGRVADVVRHVGHVADSRPWWRRLPEGDPATGRDGLERAGGLLGLLRRARAAGARASDLLELADDATGIRAVLAHLPRGARRVADHDGVVDLLRRLEQGAADALGVVRRLERLVAAGVPVPRPPLRSGGAVTLSTIHAAKGLEWPAVVVADLAGGGRPDRDDVLVDPEVGVALRWPDDRGGRTVPASFLLAAAGAARRADEEGRRLAYVAFTRSRDLLLVSDRGGPEGGLRAALGDALQAVGVACEEVADGGAAHPPGPPPLPPEPPAPDPDDPLWRRPTPRRG